MEKTESNKTKDIILVVDDQPNNLKVIAGVLSDQYSISIADSGPAALKILQKIKPQLILLDVMMPGMDGYTVCSKIKADILTRDIPVIFLSAKSDTEDIVKGFENGAVDYITKPFISAEVRTRVKNHLDLYHAVLQRQKVENELRSVLENQKEMICRFNDKLIINYYNKAFAAFWRIKPGTRPPLLISNFLTHNRLIQLKENLKMLPQAPTKQIVTQIETISDNGNNTWQEWTDYAILNNQNEIVEYQSVGIDITDRIMKHRLEKEIAIAHSNQQFKQNFLASLSHELRTPLSAITGISELMKSTALNDKQTDLLQTLDQSSENLTGVIDQLLDYAALETGKVSLKKRKIRTSDLTLKAKEFFSSICQKPLEFETWINPEVPSILEFDHIRIFQVVKNLIINAVKFTETGKVSFLITAAKALENGDYLISMEVNDTGMGIKKHKQKELFSPFSFIHEIDTANYKGVGLGLAFCREVVKLHQGEIGINSQSEKGSSVWFTFVARQILESDHEAKIRSKPHPGPQRPLNILLVEDKVVIQKVASLLLTEMGHNVTLAANGKDALEIFSENTFDIILMDIQMPVMDGITATRKFREKFKNLPPIVGHSANVFEGDREKYMALGMDEYLTKPLNSKNFSQLIEKVFEKG
jgi:CheY-like chemotaxis protein